MSTPDSTATLAGSGDTLAGTQGMARSSAGRNAALELARGTEIGRYLLVQEVGRGATGTVWSAYDGDLDRKVALKLVGEPIGDDPERRRRLLGEAQAMAKIRHPNVVLVHDVGTHAGHLYIAMEFVEGTTLGRWWRAEPRAVSEVLDVFDAAGRGLAAAHAAGLVHRDFKPDNVLVDREGRVRVADFGLAQTIDPATTDGENDGTPSHRVAGTPAYMSPEHYGGLVDARSDQFSFCVALWEALAGQRPFRGDSLVEQAAATMRAELDPADAARVPPRIRRVVAVGLATNPARRHRSMDELTAALERARRPRWPLLAALGGTAVIAVGAWALRPVASSGDPCLTGTARAAALWNDASRGSVTLQRGELAAEYVDHVQQYFVAELDAYAASWAQLHDEVCRASHQQSLGEDPLGVQRVACVEDRLAGFAGLVDLADHRALDPARVDELLAVLPPLAECTRQDAATWEPVPADAELAAQVAALRARIRDVTLRYQAAGVFEVADELAEIAAAARATGYPHVIARSLSLLGRAKGDLGELEQSTQLLDEALAVALAAGHDHLAATVAILRVHLASSNPIVDRETEHWAAIARALIERIGGDDNATGDLGTVLGTVLSNRGEYGRALAEHEIASAAYARGHGPTHAITSGAEIRCAAMLAELDRTDEAWERATAAERAIEASVGREHREVLRALLTRGLIARSLGKTDEAIAITVDALERATRMFGPHSRPVSNISYNLVSMQTLRGRIDEARVSLARSRAAWPVADDPFADAQFEEAEARIAEAAGQLDAALQHIERATLLYQRSSANYPKYLANARLVRAGLLVELERWQEALDLFAREYTEWGTPEIVGAWESFDALIASSWLGDRIGSALWLARIEAAPRRGVVHELLRRTAREIVSGRTPATLAVVRRERDRLAELTFNGDRHVRVIDAWLAGPITSAPQ